ncbi:zinc-ribbon domain-containing protein [Streptomyces sp. TRM 70361]|uniref:NADase-type glycan-binding domain-containing protein n=1 Tax=Streptomyces sp. TRM 70361 TaxID=3116553 RepID=UPI002E7ACF90|nr:zinc-ribbon domain-containing protein [Streptomyces sp. TRM 70361]MEE1940297.1 zinc-ribbon domain-containing protein [Streptomyces sp. TRM 70361]
MAVRPGREAVRRPRVREVVDDHVAAADDVSCRECGTANPAGRSFCRRCGTPLDSPSVQAGPPWWKRLLRRREARRRGPSGRLRRPLTWLALLLALAALAWVATVHGPSAVNAVRDRFSKPSSVRPESVRASSSAAGHPAELAVDGAWNRYWAPAADRAPDGQWLEASFAAPFRLTDLLFHSGSSDRADEYLRQARPASLTVTAWDEGGRKVGERTVVLEDRPGEQTVRLTVSDVSRLRLTVRTVHGQRPSRLVALGEVEFFKRF